MCFLLQTVHCAQSGPNSVISRVPSHVTNSPQNMKITYMHDKIALMHMVKSNRNPSQGDNFDHVQNLR